MTARRLWLRRREQAVQRTVPPPRDSFDVPPPVPVDGPVGMTLEVPVERSPLKLRVSRGRMTRLWLWRVIVPTGEWVDSGNALTHAEALAVGLAALEQASIGGRIL